MGFLDFFKVSDKARAKKIFEIYKDAKNSKPRATKRELFSETSLRYFRSWGLNEMNAALYTALVGSEFKDVKQFAIHVLRTEGYAAETAPALHGFFKEQTIWSADRDNAVDEAYREVF